MAMGVKDRVGYEYQYSFSVEDELVLKYPYSLVRGSKTYLIEMRTSFIIKRIDGGDEEIIDSEKYGSQLIADEEWHLPYALHTMVSFRLEDYWMTKEEIGRFEHEAIEFAKRTEADPGRAHRLVVPIGIDLEVCTVQQDNEQVGPALDRVIRAEKLVPLFLWPFPMGLEHGPPIPSNETFLYFLANLQRTRVEDVDQGLAMMQICGICLQAPTVGAQITVVPSCRHAFHSHCLVRCLLDERECPLCHSLVIFDYRAGFAEFDATV